MVFVCAHGAGKSRVAAAWFNAAAPAGWRAASAGLEPQDAVSPYAAGLLGDAAGWLDTSAPQALAQVGGDLLVGIDCEVPTARRWRLDAQWPDAAAGTQLRAMTAALVEELS
ncbi:hypothetical protein Prum_091760 [Phytohabitans rumicis]|uniref:Phosphotyrosine protein phosphatase I domain-containing protein n=1 Tax=Phytohabitans rumicis TaxID=1076125 RepID=A0A6V8LH07_9ACTN|nr:hypothetical protein Prum_091760 [Phytohabitans rumicis]